MAAVSVFGSLASRVRWLPAVALAAGVGLYPAHAFGLNPAGWSEEISLIYENDFENTSGGHPLSPDILAESLSGSGWSVTAGVTFGPPGPPQATVTAGAQTTASAALTASASIGIAFEFQIIAIAVPPVAVSTVPITLYTQGTVSTSGASGLRPRANASITVYGNSTTLVSESIYATGDPTDDLPASDAFSINTGAAYPPGIVLDAFMQATAHVSPEVSGTGTAGAIAYIDPEISVADEIIPGTTESYRDYYEIEFSQGYWALGNPTPVEPTTWGRIKSLYDR